MRNSDGTFCRAKRHIFSGKYFLINKIGSNRFVWNRNFKNGILSNSFPNKSRIVEGTFLQKKGISRELIDQACEEYYGQNEDSELEQILVQMRRKAAGKLPLSYEEKMKLMGSFYRKGFQSDSIKKALDIVVSECEHD